MERDRAGDSLNAAKRINLNRRSVRFRDALNKRRDQDDMYRIRLRSRSTVDIELSGLSRGTNADVEVYGFARGRQAVLKAIGSSDFSDLRRRDIRGNLNRLGRSRKKGPRNKSLNLDLDAGVYFVRVFQKRGRPQYQLEMDSAPAFIKVKRPNDGESLTIGQANRITWDDSIDERVKIDLFSNGSFVETIVESTKSDGRFRWKIPSTVATGGNYTVRISSTKDASLFDDSNAPFSIRNPAQSFNIQLDYRFDTQGWFTPERKAVLQTAARIWETIIQDEFDDIPKGTLLRVINPQTGSAEEFESDFVIDDVVIFAGARNTENLAVGGPSATFIFGSDLDRRFNGSDFEPWTGAMTFSETENWFFDTTPNTSNDIPINQSDFLSVALHEMGHILGFSTSNAFDALISGTAFTGTNAVAENGGNPLPLTSDRGHIRNGYEFGGSGEVLFDPLLARGDRTLPTRLDVATLDDIGYSINYNATFRNS